jgi:alkaline phosphatase
MKLRNRLLALLILAGFIGLGVLYFRTWVAPKPFGVIVFVADGLTARQIAAARLYHGGATHRLTLDGFPHVALMRTTGRDFAVPDAFAASTAIATGHRGGAGQLSMDAEARPLRTLAEIARKGGRSVGLVTNGQLTDPGLAAFYAHVNELGERRAIAEIFAQQQTADVAFGGGASVFEEAPAGASSPLALVEQRGAEILRTKAELELVDTYRTRRLVGLFSKGDLAHADQIESGSEQPSLADMVRRAIEILQTNRSGYLLVVDAGLLARSAERNQGERTLIETAALDQAIAMAIRYAGPKALIVAAGRQSIGGLSLNGYPLREDRGVALLGITPAGYPPLTWATGPNGPTGPQDAPQPASRDEPAAFHQATALPIAEDMIAAARGPGAEKLRGIIDSTEIFTLIRDAL